VAALIAAVSLVRVSTSLSRERQLQQETQAVKAKAEIEIEKSRAVTRFLKDVLPGAGASARGGDTKLLSSILDQTAGRVGRELTNQPVVAAEMLGLLGLGYQELEEYEAAEKMRRAALELDRKLYGPKSSEAASTLNDLGWTLWSKGNLLDSEGALVEALEIRRPLFGNVNAEVAASLNNLATVYRGQRRLADAEALLRESIGIKQKLSGNDSEEVAASLHNLSILLGEEGKRSESETTARELLAMRQRLPAKNQVADAFARDDIVWKDRSNGTFDETARLNLTALEIQRKILGDDNPAVAKTLSSFGELMRQRGKLTESETLLKAALSIQRKLLGGNNPEILPTLRSLVRTLEGEGKWAEAEIAEREVLSSWRTRAGNEDPEMVTELEGFVDALVGQKKLDEAKQFLDEALTPEFVSRPASVNLLARRANIMGRRGRWLEAAADATLALAHDPSTQYRYHLLALLLVKTDNGPAYEQLCRKSVTVFANMTEAFAIQRLVVDGLLLPHSGVDLQRLDKLADTAVAAGKNDDWGMLWFQTAKAMSNYRLERFAEAVEAAQKPMNSSEVEVKACACAAIAMAHWRLGQKDEARTALAKGDSLAPAPLPGSASVDLGESWVAWLQARIALDEADALIRPDAATDKK